MTTQYIPTTDEIRFGVIASGTPVEDFEAWLLTVRQQAIAEYLAERDLPKIVLEFDPAVPIHGELLALRDARLRLEGKAEGWDEGERHESEHLTLYGQFCPRGSDCNPYREASHG